MALRLNSKDPNFNQSLSDLMGSRSFVQADLSQTVAKIISEVRSRGDEALLAYTQKFDRYDALSAQALLVSVESVRAAVAECDPEVIRALTKAADRIDAYHRHQMPQNFDYVDEAGVRLGSRWTALSSVGLYVPGGTASYPSSVLMNAVPARVAGVKRLVMVVPAPDGVLSPAVLAAAQISGIEEIYTIGGAQAVAALAYGTESIRPVDKIVGPGNAYVAESKRQVFGQVGIDMIAGPSEILVVADADNNPGWIAADLLSQAEHDTQAQSILICDDNGFANAVEVEASKILQNLPRKDIASESWDKFGAIIELESLQDAPALINLLAAEHVELAVDDPNSLMEKITNAGAIFLGRYTPEAVGDYMAGPSHVLPTSRSARFSSGLGVFDFLKRSSIIGCDPGSLEGIAADGQVLAAVEGLEAHRLSLAVRSNSNSANAKARGL
jgi:histidinol dehydrogenase